MCVSGFKPINKLKVSHIISSLIHVCKWIEVASKGLPQTAHVGLIHVCKWIEVSCLAAGASFFGASYTCV